MADLQDMPPLQVSQPDLLAWGQIWLGTEGSGKAGQPNTKKANCFDKKQGMDFGYVFDRAFGASIATMLGGIPVCNPVSTSLLPIETDCVEVGTTRIVGGIRPQNFDAAYRPDGPRIVFDSKTLNDAKSVGKNWQNMVNDLATEAATVHTRFPYCVVAFVVALPSPAVAAPQRRSLARTLERLGSRKDELDQNHLAEAISLAIWDPSTGQIDPDYPTHDSILRIETMHLRVQPHYFDRYKNQPPHVL